MPKKSNWSFDLEFQLNESGAYEADVFVMWKGETRTILPLGEFGSVEEIKEDFWSFRTLFLGAYADYIKRRYGGDLIGRQEETAKGS